MYSTSLPNALEIFLENYYTKCSAFRIKLVTFGGGVDDEKDQRAEGKSRIKYNNWIIGGRGVIIKFHYINPCKQIDQDKATLITDLKLELEAARKSNETLRLQMEDSQAQESKVSRGVYCKE